ncbi:MAG: protein kinase [Bryobacter sp.]|nr:protein kinase [Bryobacter sp.]
MTGTSILHYRILGELGRGGMGVVYRALDTKLERTVAIKVLSPDRAVTPQRRERFFREARAASALNHPGIVTIYDINNADGVDVLVMEYVEGRTLHDVLEGGPLSMEQATDYALQLADALKKAHEAGIVHRDLKPGNVMVSSDGRLKILDFGLAKLVHRDGADESGETRTMAAPLTAFGQVFGTLAYMSPEQLQDDPVDARTDIYSFGVVLYEMLAGGRPFQQTTVPALIHKIVYEAPPPLKEKRTGIPPALEAIAMRCMAKAREERFASMGEVAAELRNVVAGTSTLRPKAARGKGGRRPALVLGAIALTAAVGGGFLYWQSGRSAPKTEAVVLPGEPAELQRQARGWLAKPYLQGNVDRALGALEKLVAAEPNNAAARALLAEAYWRKNGESADAHYLSMIREHAQKAIELNPELAAGHTFLAAHFIAAGKLEEAIPLLERAASADPLNPVPYVLRGNLELARKQMEAAGPAYTRAAEIGKDDWYAQMAYGVYLYRMGRMEAALSTFQRTRELAPEHPTVYQNLAGVYHHLDKDDEAASVLQRGLEVRPTAPLYNNLGTIYFYQGRYADSVQAFEKALKLSTRVTYLYWGNYGDACRWSASDRPKAGDAYARAIELAREQLTKTPKNLDVQSSLATYLAKAGQKEEAASVAAGIEGQATLVPAVRYKLAQVREIAGEREKALAHLAAALKGGYSRKEVDQDPEFLNLRKDAGYQRALLAATKK